MVSEIPESMKRRPTRSVRQGEAEDTSRGNASRRCLLYRTEGKNTPRDRAVIRSILRYLEKRQISITESYDQWVRVAFAVANTFTYDVGKTCFLRLCRLDGDAHDENGSVRLLETCYCDSRGEVSLGTILHFAQEAGYNRQRNDGD